MQHVLTINRFISITHSLLLMAESNRSSVACRHISSFFYHGYIIHYETTPLRHKLFKHISMFEFNVKRSAVFYCVNRTVHSADTGLWWWKCHFDNVNWLGFFFFLSSLFFRETKLWSSSWESANLQRAALLNNRGAFYVWLSCSCFNWTPWDRKHPHKQRRFSARSTR